MRRHSTSVTFVIMAGGRGERLWPLVRATRPKVCLSLNGTQSLLKTTIERLRPAWPRARWLIVTTREQAEAVRAQLPPTLRRALLVEPRVRSTAACMTLAAVAEAARDPHRVLVVTPADHWVGDAAAFRRAVRAAIGAAVAHDTIATIGVHPTHAHPGLGYLCAGAPLGRGRVPRVFRLERLIEKPSRALATRLLRRPHTYWNTGTFVATAEKFLECVSEWLPEHARRLVPLAGHLRHANRGGPRSIRAFLHRASPAYRALETISFDHGVMGHLRGGIVVEGRFPWADLGSWDAWVRLSQPTARTVLVDSRHVTVVSHPEHVVATIGVRNLLVVQTPSATLICHPDKVQAVRRVVRRLDADARFAAYR